MAFLMCINVLLLPRLPMISGGGDYHLLCGWLALAKNYRQRPHVALELLLEKVKETAHQPSTSYNCTSSAAQR